MRPSSFHPASALAGALAALTVFFSLSQAAPDAHRQPLATGLTPEQREILAHLSLVELDDGQGGTARTLRVSGVNLQVVNGSGQTDGTLNGVGNLILGYSEPEPNGFDRRGSHNLVIGPRHTFSSVAGIVAGYDSVVSAPYATVLGGSNNTASAYFATVCGGTDNAASDAYTTVLGGIFNEAAYYGSTVAGGENNRASGRTSTVGGGSWRTASGDYDWVAGALFQDE